LAVLRYNSAAAHLANGKGTKVDPLRYPLEIDIVRSSASAEATPAAPLPENDVVLGDVSPPEVLQAVLIPDPLDPRRKYLGYVVQDEGSGVRDIQYRYRQFVAWSSWTMASQPAPVPKDAWAVELRAVDNEGNAIAVSRYDGDILMRMAVFFALCMLFGGVLVYYMR
jgi:hypothetical protein